MNETLTNGQPLAGPFLITLDLLGTFVFALSGAAVGLRNKLDLFGLMVLAFVAGNVGGITRDILIGTAPPAAIRDWYYLAVSVMAGVVTFLWHPRIDVHSKPLLLFDGAGLALFAVTGTQKALSAGLNPVMAAMMGMVTGIGGGMLRDVLVNETPIVLRADLYAVAALAAGVVVVLGHTMNYPTYVFMMVGAMLCFWIRVTAIFRGWHLPLSERRPNPD